MTLAGAPGVARATCWARTKQNVWMRTSVHGSRALVVAPASTPSQVMFLLFVLEAILSEGGQENTH